MKVGNLYRVFIVGILIIASVIGILWRVQSRMLPRALVSETPPTQSGLSEVEFESGKQFQALQATQKARLQEYHGDPKTSATVEVPLERAIDVFLEKESK